MQVSLTQLPWYGQIGAFVVVSALGVFGFYRFYAAGEYQAIAAQQVRLEGLRTDINKGLATARRLQQFQKEVADLQVRLDALKSILPDQKDYADLLRRIQTLATQSNLTVLSFEPQPVVTRQIHAEWPIKLRLQGTYHALGLFFDKVSKFPRLIDIGDTKIQALQKQEPNATITVDCTATTFVLLDNPAPAPVAPGARPGAPGARPAAPGARPAAPGARPGAAPGGR
jgi:type IV pilus assembly protein PilO